MQLFPERAYTQKTANDRLCNQTKNKTKHAKTPDKSESRLFEALYVASAHSQPKKKEKKKNPAEPSQGRPGALHQL